MSSNVSSVAHPDTFLLADVLHEISKCIGTSWLSQNSGVHGNIHNLSSFSVELVEFLLQVVLVDEGTRETRSRIRGHELVVVGYVAVWNHQHTFFLFDRKIFFAWKVDPEGHIVTVAVRFPQEWNAKLFVSLGYERWCLYVTSSNVCTHWSFTRGLFQEKNRPLDHLDAFLVGEGLPVDPTQPMVSNFVSVSDTGFSKVGVFGKCASNGVNGHWIVELLHESQDSPGTGSGAIFELTFAHQVSSVYSFGCNPTLFPNVGLRTVIAMQYVVLSTLLVVENERYRYFSAVGPFWVDRGLSVADQISGQFVVW